MCLNVSSYNIIISATDIFFSSLYSYNLLEFIPLKVACTSGLKYSYSLVNYFERNFEHIFMKPRINLVHKWTVIQRFP